MSTGSGCLLVNRGSQLARPATHRRSRVSVTFPSSVFCCMRHTLALTVDQCGATVPPNFFAFNTEGQHPLFSSIAAFPPGLQLMMMPFHFFFIQSLSSFFSHTPTKQVFFESPFLTPTIRLSSQGSPTPRELSLQPPLGTQIPPPWVGYNHLLTCALQNCRRHPCNARCVGIHPIDWADSKHQLIESQRFGCRFPGTTIISLANLVG